VEFKPHASENSFTRQFMHLDQSPSTKAHMNAALLEIEQSRVQKNEMIELEPKINELTDKQQ
jgi:hypothetical protein